MSSPPAGALNSDHPDERVATGVELGNAVGFWPRAAARAIDLVVRGGTTFVAMICAGMIAGIIAQDARVGFDTVTSDSAQHSGLRIFLFTVIVNLGLVAYNGFCEGMHGSTIGKLAMGLVVLTEDRRPCDLKAAFIRSFAFILDGMFFGAVGYLAMRHSELRQRFGDQAAGTAVFRRDETPEYRLSTMDSFFAALFIAFVADVTILTTAYLISPA